MAAAMVVWAAGVGLVTGLYVLGPVLWFNRATPAILGMPPLYFWFVLIPLVSPGILGVVFLLDQRLRGVGADVDEKSRQEQRR